ncbi:MAG: hypothetical protein ABI970_03505, partial [Chloroflexota bacterium]
MKPKSTIPLGIFLIVVLVWAAACNLTNNNVPPTVVPRVTDTAQSPIDLETPVPPPIPQNNQANLNPSQANPLTAKANMNAILDQVDVDHLFMHVSALEALGTRHVNSQDLPNSGVQAA